MNLSQHPFEAVSRRYSLRTVLLTSTLVCVACWLATFPFGQFLLGICASVVFLLLALACATWVLGTFGTAQEKSDDESQQAANSDAKPSKVVAPVAPANDSEPQ